MTLLSIVRYLRSIEIPRSIHALGTNLILLPVGIASSILIARSLGPAGKGSFDLITATALLLAMILGLSISPGVTFVVARKNINLPLLAKQLIAIALAQAGVAGVILVGLRLTGYSTRFLPNDLGNWIIPAIALFLLFETLANHWRAMLNGKQEIIKVNTAELVGRVTQFLLLFAVAGALFMFKSRISVAVLFAIVLSISILINILLLRALWPYWRSSGTQGEFKEVLSFALPSYFANLAQFLNYRLDVFIVGIFAGFASVGRYTLAVSLAQLIWLLSNSAATVLLPKVAGKDTVNKTAHTARLSRLSFWASLGAGLTLAVFGTFGIPLLYGEAFRPSVTALLLILPGIVLFSIANILAAYLAGIGKPKLNLFVSLSSLVITVVLDLVLIPRIDIAGASIASTASYSFATILIIWLFVRESGASVVSIFLPTREDIDLLTAWIQPLLRRLRFQLAS